MIWLILNQLRTCFANPPWQTGNWPSWLVSDCLQSKTEASHCGKVCVARNRDNRAIMAEGGLSKSSKCSSAGILGIGSSRRQQILPATILGESQSRVVGKMQIDNLGFFTAATALISLFLSHHRFSNLLFPNHQAVKQTNTRYATELMKALYIVFKLCSLIVNWRLLIKAFFLGIEDTFLRF